jgi:hypothetical protein
MNNSKQEKLENFSVEIVKEIDTQKLSFMKWMSEEQNRHTTILKDISKQIDSKLQELDAVKNEIGNVMRTKPYTQSLHTRPRSTTSYEPDHTKVKHEQNDQTRHYDKLFGQDRTTTPAIRDYNEKYIKFVDRGVEFTMRDHDFKKCPPLAKPLTNGDIMVIYNQIQKSAVSYNIFLSPINHIQRWNYDETAIPPTCYLSQAQTINRPIYDRMAHALYDKLSRVNFSSTPQLEKILRQDIEEQDGFLTLYNLLSTFHPNLIEDSKRPPKPELNSSGDIYSFIAEYRLWLKFENIMNRTYTDKESVDYVISNLESDGRYDKAKDAIIGTMNTFNQSLANTGSAVFPRSLKITVLANTIMSNYTEDEASALLAPTPSVNKAMGMQQSDGGVIRAGYGGPGNYRKQVNNPYEKKRYNGNQQYQPRREGQSKNPKQLRPRINKTCQCCGTFGHCVTVNGCDFAANFINTQSYLEANPNIVDKILGEHKVFQQQRQSTTKTRPGNIAQKFVQTANRRNVKVGAKIRTLFDIVGETLEEETFDDFSDNEIDLSSDDEFQDPMTDTM